MLTLAQASTIVDKALEKGRERGFKPLTVVVLDAGGDTSENDESCAVYGIGCAGLSADTGDPA